MSYQACADCAWVAAKFETSRRREVLSFEHHRIVAKLSSEEADELLDWCCTTTTGRCHSTRERRQRRRKFERSKELSAAERRDLDEEAVSPQTATSLLLAPEQRKEVQEERAEMITKLIVLLQLDLVRTVEEIIRQFRNARRDIQNLPMEKRLAFARGLLRALEVSPEDLNTGW